jgi:hypothetical protein
MSVPQHASLPRKVTLVADRIQPAIPEMCRIDDRISHCVSHRVGDGAVAMPLHMLFTGTMTAFTPNRLLSKQGFLKPIGFSCDRQ